MGSVNQPSSGLLAAACVAVAALSLWSTVDFYRATTDLAGDSADVYKMGEQAARFQALSAALPPTGILGYVSDQPTQQNLGAVMYHGAQYALAPRLLSERLERADLSWVVGNFSKPLDLGQFAQQHALTVVRDLGSGVVLFRRGAG